MTLKLSFDMTPCKREGRKSIRINPQLAVHKRKRLLLEQEIYPDYHGYQISHYVPDMYKIDPNEGNGDEEEFYRNLVYFEVMDKLDSLGIGPSAVV